MVLLAHIWQFFMAAEGLERLQERLRNGHFLANPFFMMPDSAAVSHPCNSTSRNWP